MSYRGRDLDRHVTRTGIFSLLYTLINSIYTHHESISTHIYLASGQTIRVLYLIFSHI